MRTIKHWALAAAAAAALALAGCGGGGGSSSSAPPAPPAPVAVSMAAITIGGTGYMAPEAGEFTITAGMSRTSGSVTFTCAAGGDDCTVMVAANGAVSKTGGMVTAMNSVAYQAGLDNAAALGKATALNTSVGTLKPLAGAVDADGSALMMAKKYSAMIGTEASDGDSMVAMMNADKVLNARKMLMGALTAAKNARTAAMEAKDDLGDAGHADVVEALDMAIKAANTQITAAEKVLNGDDLKMYVEMVTGDDEDDVKDATYRGEQVAKAVAMALAPMVAPGGTNAADGTGVRVTADVNNDATVDVPPGLRAADNAVAMANKYEAVSRDPTSMTWAMIVGEDNVMDMQIADGTTGNFETVKAASVSGMILGSSQTAGEVAEGVQVDTGVTYKGIPGGVFCGGSDCMVETVADVGTSGQPGFVDNSGNRKLVGSWYFTPANEKAFWMKAADATVYTEDTLFATYGHWLVVDDGAGTAENAGQVTVVTYAYGPTGNDASLGWGERASGTPTSEQAVYEGMAAGRSVHKVSNDDVVITEVHSGRFMASVMLTAKFGATPMLGGKVYGFTSDNPDAYDSSWTVTLQETAVASGLVTAGVAKATGQDGDWTARAYGGVDDDAGTADVNETKRPEGILGTFNAHFTDGHVAGAYATRND